MKKVIRFVCESCGKSHREECATSCKKCGIEICPNCWIKIDIDTYICDNCL